MRLPRAFFVLLVASGLVLVTAISISCANGTDPKATPETKAATESKMSSDSKAAPKGQGMEITFASGTETIGGYLTRPDTLAVRPEGEKPSPAVIVVHEWWGLNDQMRVLADRLANEGYVVLAPDLYRGKVAKDPEGAHELMRGLSEDRAVSDLRAAIAKIRSLPGMTTAKVGIVGFCMGGRLALLTAMGSPDLAATAVFYGRPETDPEKLRSIRGPVLGVFGGTDQGIGPDQVNPFREGLQKAGVPAEVKVYEGAGHAFMNETGRNYNEKAAKEAWALLLDFFSKHLKA